MAKFGPRFVVSCICASKMTDVSGQFGERIEQLLRMSDKQRANYIAEKNSRKKKVQETEAQPEELSSKILVCNPFELASKMMQCTASSFAHLTRPCLCAGVALR